MQSALKPKVSIPFAGKYILGGKLHQLNPFRGVADSIEIAQFDSTAVVLADGGNSTINTETLSASAIRNKIYDKTEIEQYAKTLAKKPMLYEEYFSSIPLNSLPIKRLLPKAYHNAISKSLCHHDFYFCIQLKNEWAVINTNPKKASLSYQNNIERECCELSFSADFC